MFGDVADRCLGHFPTDRILLLTPHSSLLTPHFSLLTPHSSLLTPHSLLSYSSPSGETSVDRQTLVLFIPIIALSIPVIALVLSGLRKYWQMRIEEARSRGGSLGPGAEVELEQMRSELDQVRRELGEVQERLDFTERLLARTDRERLGGPPSPQA